MFQSRSITQKKKNVLRFLFVFHNFIFHIYSCIHVLALYFRKTEDICYFP